MISCFKVPSLREPKVCKMQGQPMSWGQADINRLFALAQQRIVEVPSSPPTPLAPTPMTGTPVSMPAHEKHVSFAEPLTQLTQFKPEESPQETSQPMELQVDDDEANRRMQQLQMALQSFQQQGSAGSAGPASAALSECGMQVTTEGRSMPLCGKQGCSEECMCDVGLVQTPPSKRTRLMFKGANQWNLGEFDVTAIGQR